MIIGNGDVASALINLPLPKRNNYIFFASGVSNSREKRESEYQREKDLLMAQNKTKHIIYFSSLCIFYSENRYAKHKRQMETLIKKYFKHYTIFRLGNITWGNNPHTIINYFRERLKKHKKLEILDAYRYLVNKSEFQHWINMIPDWNCEMNITGRMLKPKDIIKEIKANRL